MTIETNGCGLNAPVISCRYRKPPSRTLSYRLARALGRSLAVADRLLATKMLKGPGSSASAAFTSNGCSSAQSQTRDFSRAKSLEDPG